MKNLGQKFNRFCLRNSNRGIHNLMLYISVGIAVVFFFEMIDPSNTIYGFLCFSRAGILHGQLWRIITYVFIPNVGLSSVLSLFFLALQLWFYYYIGRVLEGQMGTLKFNIFYITGILITAAAAILLQAEASATYMNFSLLLAYATLFPENSVYLFPIPIRIKMKYLALLYAALIVFEVLTNSFPANLLPIFSLLNYFIFFYSDLKSFIGGFKMRRSKTSTNYRHQQREKVVPLFRHKCSVCGKTDTEYPNLEFRYCSKCNGYYCYCSEHINNHTHVQ